MAKNLISDMHQMLVAYVHYRQKISMDEALYEVKWLFSSEFLLCKSTATLLPTRYVLANNETFQMRYCTMFYLKGHKNYNRSNLKAPKKAYFIK